MGVVVRFPKKSRRRTRKKKGPWRMKDLRGKKPLGHKLAKRGPGGKILLAKGQVWVEGHTQRLWRVIGLYRVRESFYPYDVVFEAYGDTERRCLSEAGFRAQFKVWEDWIESHKELMEKFNFLSENDPQSPFRGRGGRIAAQNFFGLDAQGYRVD